MEISTKIRVVTADHRCTVCLRSFGSATLLRFHQASQHKSSTPPQRAMRLSSTTNDPATPSSQVSSDSQHPSDDCQQTFANGSINGFYSSSTSSTPEDHCTHITSSQPSIPNSSIRNHKLSLESDEIVTANHLDHVNNSCPESLQQKIQLTASQSSQSSSLAITQPDSSPITPIVSPDVAEKLLSDAVEYIKMLEGVQDSLSEASTCLQKAKILTPPDPQNNSASEPDSSNANEPMLTDSPSILKQCPNDSTVTSDSISRRLSSNGQNLDALIGLDLLSSVSLAVSSDSAPHPAKPSTDSLEPAAIIQPEPQSIPSALNIDTKPNPPPTVSSGDHLDRACDLLGFTRALSPESFAAASASPSSLLPFVGPRTLAQHNLADAHERTFRARSDLQLVEQRTREAELTFRSYHQNGVGLANGQLSERAARERAANLLALLTHLRQQAERPPLGASEVP